jgi:hypothetical protein
MSVIGLLIVLLVFCVVIWAVRRILGAFGIGDPISTVVQVLFVLVFILWLLQNLGYVGLGRIPDLR